MVRTVGLYPTPAPHPPALDGTAPRILAISLRGPLRRADSRRTDWSLLRIGILRFDPPYSSPARALESRDNVALPRAHSSSRGDQRHAETGVEGIGRLRVPICTDRARCRTEPTGVEVRRARRFCPLTGAGPCGAELHADGPSTCATCPTPKQLAGHETCPFAEHRALGPGEIPRHRVPTSPSGTDAAPRGCKRERRDLPRQGAWAGRASRSIR